uniref:Reelin domain-containing protein n=1 Tax=Timema genevievae TaxID=629358 RepID=A0A7R9K2W2_TIMGE|nr:unnamed protein product [Timema genevievae]
MKALGIEPGTSGFLSKIPDHQNTEAITLGSNSEDKSSKRHLKRLKLCLLLLSSVLAVTLLAALTAGLPLEPEIKFTTSTVAPLDPDHVPSSVCRSMIPSHGASTPQNGVAPYEISLSSSSVAPGGVVQVTLSGKGVEEFKGIYVQGRVGDEPVGKFLPHENKTVIISDCPPSQQNAASYVSRQSVNSVTLNWVAPDEPSTVVFRWEEKDGGKRRRPHEPCVLDLGNAEY